MQNPISQILVLNRGASKKRDHTNCLSLAAEMLVLGVATRASSHPVGSKSLVWAAPESNVEPTASIQMHQSSNP